MTSPLRTAIRASDWQRALELADDEWCADWRARLGDDACADWLRGLPDGLRLAWVGRLYRHEEVRVDVGGGAVSLRGVVPWIQESLRLVGPVECVLPWPAVSERWALWCVARAVEHAAAELPRWEREYPDDHRPRRAIETARRWLRGEATSEECQAAARSAYAAARLAARPNGTWPAYVARAAARAAAAATHDAARAAHVARDAADAIAARDAYLAGVGIGETATARRNARFDERAAQVEELWRLLTQRRCPRGLTQRRCLRAQEAEL